jgi:hypothetical protein
MPSLQYIYIYIFSPSQHVVLSYLSVLKQSILKKTHIILLLTRITSFHVYVLERYDICMVWCDAQREWHVTGSALSWCIVLSCCDVITIMLWQNFTVEVVRKVISVGTPAIRHIHDNKFYLLCNFKKWPNVMCKWQFLMFAASLCLIF